MCWLGHRGLVVNCRQKWSLVRGLWEVCFQGKWKWLNSVGGFRGWSGFLLGHNKALQNSVASIIMAMSFLHKSAIWGGLGEDRSFLFHEATARDAWNMAGGWGSSCVSIVMRSLLLVSPARQLLVADLLNGSLGLQRGTSRRDCQTDTSFLFMIRPRKSHSLTCARLN